MTGALTLAWVEGTYLGTTTALSRHEHVAVAGLGERGRATMVVDDRTMRWERQGSDVFRVAGSRLLGVGMEGSLVETLLGRAKKVRVEWTTDHTDHTDHNVTRFQPRARADSAALVSAVQRLMEFGPATDDSPTTPDGPL
ncbi:MAG: hypothetical protein H7270_12125 [Dermatophilaceae bacterium]|nr:hypothetical protein [Dermatophilaceae bacterium]